MGRDNPDMIVLEMTGLKALAHPLRVAILDTLSAYGAATASALAERLGESSGATSYHLRQLEKHGFVREDITRGRGRERWWERVPRPIMLEPAGFAPDSAEMVATGLIVAEWQRNRQARLEAYLARGREALGAEWVEAGITSTTNVQLTLEQSRELAERLSAVLDEYVDRYRHQKVAGARPVQVHVDVFALVDGVEQTDPVGGSGKDDR